MKEIKIRICPKCKKTYSRHISICPKCKEDLQYKRATVLK